LHLNAPVDRDRPVRVKLLRAWTFSAVGGKAAYKAGDVALVRVCIADELIRDELAIPATPADIIAAAAKHQQERGARASKGRSKAASPKRCACSMANGDETAIAKRLDSSVGPAAGPSQSIDRRAAKARDASSRNADN
jgi:hypothetical protein